MNTQADGRAGTALRALFCAHLWVEDEDLGLYRFGQRNARLPGGPCFIMSYAARAGAAQ